DTRTDLAVVKKNLQVNDVTLRYLNNQTLPQTDLQVRYALAGQGGTLIQRQPGIAGSILNTVPGGYSDALDTLLHGKYPTWNVQVGMATKYFVVQAQRDLATAQNNELQAVLAYRKSLVKLERLQQTTLTNSNITIISATGGNGIAAIQ